MSDNFPPLPEPYTVASTMKCVACGAPYEPSRALAPNAAGGIFSRAMSSSACKCGSTTFGGTASYDMPSPAQFTADQMRAYALAALASQAESEARDAARYRWLREFPNNIGAAVYGATGGLLRRDTYLDAAIDAAMAEKEQTR